jgi:NADH-quinone oxidoreductase subunit L
MTHAFFKALLFLGAGSVIHSLGGEQDMRLMGGLRKHIPWTFWTMTAATFAIAGFPPLAGFFSKDEILWKAFSSEHGSTVVWAIGIITAFITSFYMFRLWFMTFFGEFRGADTVGREHAGHGHAQHAAAEHGHIHESPKVMTVPLAILAVLSVIGGWIGWPESIGGNQRFDHFLAPVFTHHAEEAAVAEAAHSTELMMAGISILAAVAGFALAWFLYYRRRDLPDRIAASLGSVYRLVCDKYRIDELYAAVIVNPLIAASRVLLWRGVDVGAIDGTINNSAHGAQEVSDAVRHMQSGNIRSYAGWVALGAALVVAYMIWMGAR